MKYLAYYLIVLQKQKAFSPVSGEKSETPKMKPKLGDIAKYHIF